MFCPHCNHENRGSAKFCEQCGLALRETAERHSAPNRTQAILDSVTDAIFISDNSGIVDCNRASATVFGFDRKEDLIGIHAWALSPEVQPDGEISAEIAAKRLGDVSAGKRQTFDWVHQRRSGETFPAQVTLSPFPLENGTGFLGVVRDVTERHRAEEQIRSSEARLRAIIDGAVDGIVSIDEEGIVHEFSPSAETIFGYARKEILGRNVRMLMPEPERSNYNGYMRQFLETGEARIIGSDREVTGLRKDGTAFPMDLAVSATEIQGRTYFTGIIRDITERKQAAQRLAEKEEQLAAAIENMEGGFFLLDEELKFVVFNRWYVEKLGYPENLVRAGVHVSKAIEFQAQKGAFGQPDDIEKVVADRIYAFTRNDFASFEIQLEDGRICSVNYSRTMNGGYTCVLVDITDRKRAERTLAQKEEQLRLALENMPGGFYMLDPDLNVVLYNQQFVEMGGYTEGFIQPGLNIRDIVRFRALKGDYGNISDIEQHVSDRVAAITGGATGHTEMALAGDRSGEVSYRRTDDGGFIGVVVDVTETRIAENALRRNEERMRDIIEGTLAGMVVSGFDTIIIFANQSAVDMIGYDSVDDMVGSSYYDSIDPRDLQMAKDRRAARDRGETTPSRYEYRVLKRDGTTIWIEVNTRTITWEGKLAMQSSFLNVTDRKEAEEALQANRQLLENVLENTDQGIVAFDQELRLQAWNKRYQEILELPQELMSLGQPVEDIARYLAERGVYGEGDIDVLVAQRIQQLREEQATHIQIGGKYFHVLRQITADGGLVITYTDLTELRQTQGRLSDTLELMTSSIAYASRIQRSVLPTDMDLEEALGEYFVVWEPRDVVGGDFYIIRLLEQGHLLVLGDCTGHGVPGAFMTLIATGALDQALMGTLSPSAVIGEMNKIIRSTLGQDKSYGESDDGLELGVCLVDRRVEELRFAGARFSLWVADSSGVQKIQGDRKGIGYRSCDPSFSFTEHRIRVTPGATFLMATDGLFEQLGGPKRIAYGSRRFAQLLEQLHSLPAPAQRQIILDDLAGYQGQEPRRDDLSIVGFRPLLN